jgi:hypothetical protein
MHRVEFTVPVLLLSTALLTVACGGSAPSSEPATPAAAPAAEPPPAPAQEAAPAAMTAPTNEAQYEAAELAVSDHFRTLRDQLDAKAAEAVANEARQLEQRFAGIETFWTERKADDAIGFAKAARAAAQSIVTAAEANDLAGASKAAQTLDAQCQACHKAHRQQDGDYFSIK